jgi:hypothetical protein
MAHGDPLAFCGWTNYMRHRQVMLAAIALTRSGWEEWEQGHAQLLAVFLWEYEGRRLNSFRYAEFLKKNAYRRSHNYRLLQDLLGSGILRKEGRGVYRLSDEILVVVDRAILVLREADGLCRAPC